MLVAAASDLLPNVRSKYLCCKNADIRSEERQTDIPPVFDADRNRHFYHLRMSSHVNEAYDSGQSYWSSLNLCSLLNPILSLEQPMLNLPTKLPICCSGSHYGWTSVCTSFQLSLLSSVRPFSSN